MVYTIAARAADDDPPPPPSRFRPWQQVWQCNDIRVTGTRPLQHRVRPWWYDLGRWPLHRDQRRSLLQRATLSTIATGRLLMKKLLPIGIAALSVLSASAARAEDPGPITDPCSSAARPGTAPPARPRRGGSTPPRQARPCS